MRVVRPVKEGWPGGWLRDSERKVVVVGEVEENELEKRARHAYLLLPTKSRS